MFIYQSRFLTRGEVWYDDEPDNAPVDWIYYRQRSSPVAGARSRETHTLLVDLTPSPDQLLARMDQKTALKINAALAKDHLAWERGDARDAKTLNEVERLWNEFAAAHKSPPLERDWFDKIAEAGNLNLSAAKDPTGQTLAYHLVLLTRQRARQLIAISPYRALPDAAWRNAVSRANCFIHWKNFLDFRTRGIPFFDWGGWYMGTTNIQYLGINRFKQSFGGRIVREFECEQIRTLKGWCVLTAARLIRRAGLLKPTAGGSQRPAPSPKPTTHATAKDSQISPAF